jgi:hypothetical protein
LREYENRPGTRLYAYKSRIFVVPLLMPVMTWNGSRWISTEIESPSPLLVHLDERGAIFGNTRQVMFVKYDSDYIDSLLPVRTTPIFGFESHYVMHTGDPNATSATWRRFFVKDGIDLQLDRKAIPIQHRLPTGETFSGVFGDVSLYSASNSIVIRSQSGVTSKLSGSYRVGRDTFFRTREYTNFIVDDKDNCFFVALSRTGKLSLHPIRKPSLNEGSLNQRFFKVDATRALYVSWTTRGKEAQVLLYDHKRNNLEMQKPLPVPENSNSIGYKDGVFYLSKRDTLTLTTIPFKINP